MLSNDLGLGREARDLDEGGNVGDRHVGLQGLQRTDQRQDVDLGLGVDQLADDRRQDQLLTRVPVPVAGGVPAPRIAEGRVAVQVSAARPDRETN